jgi:hypothetical protein
MPFPYLVRVVRTAVFWILVGTTTAVYGQVQCWAPREHLGPITDQRWARHLKAMNAAEFIVKQSQELLHPPVPVRIRSTMAATRFGAMDSRLIIRAYPEETLTGIRLWRAECGLIREADLMAGSIGSVNVFFNHVSKDMFMGQDEIPKATGTLSGYPEYNGWVVISKNGRLPWIPQTLGDRLDRIGAARERALADWRSAKASRTAPDPAMIDRTAALRRKSDPAGAEQYVENMRRLTTDIEVAHAKDAAREAHLTKLLNEYRAYRTSFTAQQLVMPAVWADPDGSVRKAMEAQIDELQKLGVEDQVRVGERRDRSRDLERAAAVSANDEEARRLRMQAGDLLLEVERVLREHMERASLEEDALRSAYELTNLKPGPAEQAMAYKMDPTFPNRSRPGTIQVIAVSASTKDEDDILERPEHTARKVWLDRVKSSINYAALAALLD